MARVEHLRARRKQLLGERGKLEDIRRGSVVEHFVEAVGKDGSTVRRGPYILCSFKDRGRSVSRRVTEPRQTQVYREQIGGFRRFREVVKEVVAIGEQLSDLALSGAQEVKKTPKSRSRKTRK